MGRLTILLLIALCILIATTNGAKGDKKGDKKGNDKGGCKGRDEKTIAKCFKKGFQTSLEGCEADEKKMKNREVKRCKKVEGRLKKCGFNCIKPLTKAPTKPPTKPPTKAPTKAPTKPPTKAPTKPPTKAPTKPPTKAPTKPPTKPPTKAPTKPPTKAPTKPPTKPPTESPEQKISELVAACSRKDTNFPGADIFNRIYGSVEDCATDCLRTKNCVALVFRESDNQCQLKSKRGGSNGPIVDPGHNSMNMECDNSAVTNLNCIREGFNFPGNDIRNLLVADEEACVRLCRDTEGCSALTFRESDNRCYLKSKRGGSNGPIVDPGHNSMNMECDNTKVDLSCVEEDSDFPGYNIRSLTLDNLETCISICRDTQDCLAVTFKEQSTTCDLKRKEFDWWEKNAYTNAKSTIMNC